MMNPNDRITPKFRNSQNFKNVLEFLTTYDDESLNILNDVNNMDSQYGFILDEIGKTLGIYPRPFVPNTIGDFPTFFVLDISELDTVPMVNDPLAEYRQVSNLEYSKLLRVFAKGINFRGTIQEWEDILFVLTGAKTSFDSKPSRFGLVVQKDLNILDKALVEYALRYNSLTVNIDYVGTTSEGLTPFLLDVTPLDEGVFIEPW